MENERSLLGCGEERNNEEEKKEREVVWENISFFVWSRK